MNARQTEQSTETRRANAMAAFIETVAKVRKDQIAGKLPMTAQANTANVAALEASAAKIRRGAKTCAR